MLRLLRFAHILFDRSRDRSSVPTCSRHAIAHSVGPGRPKGRRDGSLSWTVASGLARDPVVFLIAIFASTVGATAVSTGAEPLPAFEHPRSSSQTDPFAGFVLEASKRFVIPEQWIRAVMQVESGNNPKAVSPRGAMGLMQIMPDTWAELRARYNLGADPFDPHDSILAGAAYLHEMHDRFGNAGFLAAYNAGPARYGEHLATGRPLPDETIAYVTVLNSLLDLGATGASPTSSGRAISWREAPLFVLKRGTMNDVRPALLTPLGINAPGGASALAPRSQGLFLRQER